MTLPIGETRLCHMTSELEGAMLDAAVAKAEGVGFDKYSTRWSLAGPIIERELIEWYPAVNGYCAFIGVGHDFEQSGPTLLIAAMRTYVASKFGGEVKLPEGDV